MSEIYRLRPTTVIARFIVNRVTNLSLLHTFLLNRSMVDWMERLLLKQLALGSNSIPDHVINSFPA